MTTPQPISTIEKLREKARAAVDAQARPEEIPFQWAQDLEEDGCLHRGGGMHEQRGILRK